MVFIETPLFSRLLASLMDDEQYRTLQNTLLRNPAAGDLIPAGGGIRKVRYALTERETAVLRELVKELKRHG